MAESASLFDQVDEAAEARAVAKARAEIAAGQGVPHDKVVEWLQSWGTTNEKPCPVPEPR